MVGEALVVAGSSLVVFCSLFEWRESLGYAFFHLVRKCTLHCCSSGCYGSFCILDYVQPRRYCLLGFLFSVIIVALLPSLSSGWTVGIKKWIKFR